MNGWSALLFRATKNPLSLSIMVVAAAWLIYEALVLDGTTVVDEHYKIGSRLEFNVDEPTADYRVTIGRKKGGSGGVKRVLRYTLVGPDGEKIHSARDQRRKRRRDFTFKPRIDGTYTLIVADASSHGYAGYNYSWIKVEKNDRTFLLHAMDV